MGIMMTNADGTQSEVFTKKEMEDATKNAADTATKAATDVATKANEVALEAFKKENPSGAKKIEELTKDLEEKTKKVAELEKDGGGDGGGKTDEEKKENDEQIKRLKGDAETMKKDLEEKIEDMGKALKTVTGDARKELIDAAVKGASQSDIEAAGGKEEFEKKLGVEFDSFSGEVIARTDIAERVAKSVTLVTGNKPAPSTSDGITDSGGKGNEEHKENKEVSETTKKVGNALGITDEDRKDFGPGGSKNVSKKVGE